jgi:hypothetical protein
MTLHLNHHTEHLANGRALKVIVERGDSPIAYSEVLQLWQTDADFRVYFISILTGCPFSAFRWETPPITLATANRPFEFVLLDSPGLAAKPDFNSFAAHFSDADVVEFANLGKDAILVVPCPSASRADYGHLAAFLRNAPETQKHALWQCVGAVMQRRLSDKPVWLSTAGAGVSWLHVRLDDRPKYYGHAPYRNNVVRS